MSKDTPDAAQVRKMKRLAEYATSLGFKVVTRYDGSFYIEKPHVSFIYRFGSLFEMWDYKTDNLPIMTYLKTMRTIRKLAEETK